jgi:hypothetical protein
MPTKSKISKTIELIFSNPPIMLGEDPAAFEELKELVLAEVQPKTMQEVLLARDITVKTWESLRFPLLKSGMVDAQVPHIIVSESRSVLLELLLLDVRQHLSRIRAGDPVAKKEFEKLLQEHGLILSDVRADAYAKTILAQLHTDRMASAADQQIKASYAELERLRAKEVRAAETQTRRIEDDELDLGGEAPATAPVNDSPVDPRDQVDAGSSVNSRARDDVSGKD